MITTSLLLKAYRLMCAVHEMAATYESNRPVCKYVHSTSRGHEAIQLATAFHLQPQDYVSPYYRDESLLLGLGFTPFELMLQLLAKKDDPFTGGREYYSHPNFRGAGKPTIIHQSSATGMQAIPTTGIAQGIQLREKLSLGGLATGPGGEPPIVVCSLGDASITEGEVSEALQVAVLRQLPVIYLVQDNHWGISVRAEEARAMNAFEWAAGFKGLHRVQVDGSDLEASWEVIKHVTEFVRAERKPFLVHAQVPLLGHHTSGVRKEFYRPPEDLAAHAAHDPRGKLRRRLLESGTPEPALAALEGEVAGWIRKEFEQAVAAAEPDPATVGEHVFAPTPVTREQGTRRPAGAPVVPMVDAALYAIREILEDFPEAVLFGQDVGRRLGGVFREAATLAQRFGDDRVFNTAIQEAYIIGSTVGLSAVGIKPIVEVQFADYIFPGFNQLVSEVSKSCYLTCGRFPVQMVLRVPTGAYGGGGPYHSASIESALLSVKGIKVVYPSNAADMKGLMKAAFLDPNPVVILEHKGLYWSKLPGTESAKQPEPSRDYLLPLGKAALIQDAGPQWVEGGESALVITYGMGVYWALEAARTFPGQIAILDLRTLYPLDETLVFDQVRRHGRCLILSEEPQNNSFAEALAGRISRACFPFLDAPVDVLGARNLPAVPMNLALEHAMLPTGQQVAERLKMLLNY